MSLGLLLQLCMGCSLVKGLGQVNLLIVLTEIEVGTETEDAIEILIEVVVVDCLAARDFWRGFARFLSAAGVVMVGILVEE
jgi:hypothetical protein